MPSPLSQAGAVGAQSKFAPLHTNRFFTGLWTQRSPLRDAAVPFVYEKFYAASRFDSLIDGLNMELTARLTLARRPGHSVYNAQVFPAINRFYEFRTFSTTAEIIHVMADCVGNVYDATGPNTKLNIWTKSAGAGSTYFQGVGNSLYMGNGIDQKKWLQSTRKWVAATTFKAFEFLVDSNNNLQVATGARTLQATNVQVVGNVCTITFSARAVLMFYVGMTVSLAGFSSTGAFLNGFNVVITAMTYNQITFAFVHADVNGADTGSASTAGGNTGGVQPAWGNTIGAITVDGAEQWLCKGTSVQNWGIAAPNTSPTVANSARPSIYPRWVADTYYSSSLTIIEDGFIFRLTTGGQTGAVEPVWDTVTGHVTADGTAAWTCIGSAAWVAATGYAIGDQIQVTWTYWVTVPSGDPPCFSPNVPVETPDGPREFGKMPASLVVMTEAGPMMADLLSHDFNGMMIDMGSGQLVTFDHRFKRGDEYVRASVAFPNHPRVHYKGKVYNLSVRTKDETLRHYILENGEIAHNSKAPPDPGDPPPSDTYPVTVTAVWRCITAGITGGSQPAWVDGNGATVADNTVVWQNVGSGSDWEAIGANALVSLATIVIDSNGNKQQISTTGKSAAAEPVWKTVLGQTTVDNAATWVNAGAFSGANTAPWIYSFAPKNSLSGEVATASPLSAPIVLAANKIITVQGPGSDDTQCDVIQLYRTAAGGSTQLLLDEIPSPGPGQTWTYFDSTVDTGLSTLTQAQIALSNAPPPAGIIALAYHLRRVWGAVSNTLYFSAGPDTLNGNGNSCFPPANSFVFPSQITRLWPTSIGLLVFTVSDVYIVQGLGTPTQPFYPNTFLEGIGLLNYDAFTVNGSTAHLLTSARKQVALDPGAGLVEEGFPIGDLFDTTFDAHTAYCSWHESASGDTAMFVSDGATGWFRLSPTSAPETGAIWSPRAVIAAGCKAVQSLEVAPGTVQLLIGPGNVAGPILYRDRTVNKDNAATFACFATIGSVTLAQPGQLAELLFFTLDSMKVGSRATVGVRLDEIAGAFGNNYRTVQDPPMLPPSNTLYNDRYYMAQNQQATYCRHFQVKFSWIAEDVPTELLSYTIFGALHQEKHQ